MKFWQRRLSYGLLAILPLCQAITSPVSAEELTADQVIARAMANRMKVESYDVVLEIEYGNQNGEGLAEQAHFYRAENQLRVDMRYPAVDNSRLSRIEQSDYWLRTVFTPKRSIVFCDIDGPQQRAINIDCEPARTLSDWEEESRRYDLRSLGFQTAGPLSADDMNSLFDSAAGEKTVVSETVEQFECCKVSFALKSGVECALWFAKSLDYAPILLQCHSQNEKHRRQIALDVEEWKESGLYFPVRYETAQTIGGKSETLQRGRLLIRSLNASLAAETFELTGLQIPEGKSIQLLPSNGPAQMWDGEKIVLKRQR